jgi:hypothetical protein
MIKKRMRNCWAKYLIARKNTLVQGDMLLVKNRPRNTIWDAEFMVKEVADMIWWYYKSGQDISTVFGEWELERFIGQLE